MKDQKTFISRKLRNNLTESEKHLWYVLRAENLGFKFRRQEPIGNYIVDFVCYPKKLIIELDGGQHFGSADDQARDKWLESQGFKVLRFWNNEVLENRDGVVFKIMEYLKQPPP